MIVSRALSRIIVSRWVDNKHLHRLNTAKASGHFQGVKHRSSELPQKEMHRTFSKVSMEATSKGTEALHMGQAGSFSYFTVWVYTPSMPVYLQGHSFVSPKMLQQNLKPLQTMATLLTS